MPKKLLISPESLADDLESRDLQVVDCRFDLMAPGAGREQYLASHIPGASYADLDADLAAPVGPMTGRHPLPDVGTFCATLGRLGVGNSSHVVVYDGGNGGIAARLWWLLRWLGHESVSLLDGGFAAWEAAGLPVRTGPERIATARFEGVPDPDMVIETRDLHGTGAPYHGAPLIDARDAARFRGEIEPIDAVAGHIPEARNLPFAEAISEEGNWRSVPELQDLWAHVVGADPDAEFTVMCGSGVTACHLALSASLAGYRLPRVYVGSWSEWIRDPERPIATSTG